MAERTAPSTAARIPPGAQPTPRLIITRTPLRISLAGGGTDLPAFYERDYGAVFSTAIRQLHLRHGQAAQPTVQRADPAQLLAAARRCTAIDELENDIARECLRFMEIEPPIYISTVGDHPGLDRARKLERLRRRAAERAARLPRRARHRRPARRGGVAHRDRRASASRSASRTSTPRRSAGSTSSSSSRAAR